MKTPADVSLSVLDLCPVRLGGDAAEAFRNTLDLARHADRLGYERYWLAEHHGLPGVASAATAVVIGQMDGLWTPAERAAVERRTACSAVGAPDTVREALGAIAEATGAGELILTTQVYDHAARVRSFELVAGAWTMADPAATPVFMPGP